MAIQAKISSPIYQFIVATIREMVVCVIIYKPIRVFWGMNYIFCAICILISPSVLLIYTFLWILFSLARCVYFLFRKPFSVAISCVNR